MVPDEFVVMVFAAPPAVKVKPPLVAVIPASIAILFAAFNVKVLLLDQVTGLTTVMLPVPVPLALVVVTSTLELPRAVCKLATVRSESETAPDAANVLLLSVLALVLVPTMPAPVAA